MNSRVRTSPDLANDSPVHMAAREEKNFAAWSQNVIDQFKGMSPEEIRPILKSMAFPYAVCFEHWVGDFNMGTGIRNANAFNANEVFYIGDKKWDRRSAVGVYNYTPINWVSTVEEFLTLKEKYVFIGVDNVEGSVPLSTFVWPENAMMIFGEEGTGLTPEIQKHCQALVAIEMFGSVRSLNCGTASGIVMYDYISKFQKGK
jgi:tRNA G18 (ribose-2'-O)-methylase SpoU